MSTVQQQPIQGTVPKPTDEQHKVVGKEDIKSKGKVEAEEGVMGQKKPEQMMTGMQQQQMGTQMQQPQEKLVEFRGRKWHESNLEVRDINCMLKMCDHCTHITLIIVFCGMLAVTYVKMTVTVQQKFLLGNLFVEYANISSPEEIKDKLPTWPMEKPWYAMSHVPMQEKRTFSFSALLPIFLEQILTFPEFKDFQGDIGTIDYNTILSDKTQTYPLRRPTV